MQHTPVSNIFTFVTGLADLRTDWALLSALLRRAQRDGWNVTFKNGSVLVVPRQSPAPGVAVLPAALLGQARATGWSVSRREGGFELRHPAVRHRIEVRLAAA